MSKTHFASKRNTAFGRIAVTQPSDRLVSTKYERMEINRLVSELTSDLCAHAPETLWTSKSMPFFFDPMAYPSELEGDKLRLCQQKWIDESVMEDVIALRKRKKANDLLSLRLLAKLCPSSRDEEYREKRELIQLAIEDLRRHGHPRIESILTIDAMERLYGAVPAMDQIVANDVNSEGGVVDGTKPWRSALCLISFRIALIIGSSEVIDFLTADYARAYEILTRYYPERYEDVVSVVDGYLEHGALSNGLL